MKYSKGILKYIIKIVIGDLALVIGGLLVFLCLYWLFHLDT